MTREEVSTGPVAPTRGRFTPLASGSVRITGGFWGGLQDLNGSVIIDHAQSWMERLGWIRNFDLAVEGTLPAGRHGREFSDSDVYKLMEAIAWEHGRTGDPDWDRRFVELAERILPVQEPDGYLNTMFGRRGQEPRYSDFEFGHELYCYGHLIQAAVARARTAGNDRFVEAALRAADHVCLNFGADGRAKVPGHPVIEMALVEAYRLTGRSRYLEQARLFVERRGHGLLADIEWGRSYYQDRVPVEEAKIAEGHAVRAMYLAAGATDVAVECSDDHLLAALADQALATLARRTHLTGAMGSRHEGESFGEDFELPPDRAYGETCAGVGAVQFLHRLNLATGDVRFADAVERVLFNVVAASPSADGRSFFYSNTLHRRTLGAAPDPDRPSPRADSSSRASWYEVSCCPTNVSRTLASLAALLASTDDGGVQVHQFAPGELTAEGAFGRVRLAVHTDYPTSGVVTFRAEEASDAWTLSVRIPAWASHATVNGVQVKPGYVALPGPATGEQLMVDLGVEPRWTWPAPPIDAVRGQVAVERGPVVLCLESVDLQGRDLAGVSVDVSAGLAETDDGVLVALSVAVQGASAWPYSTAPAMPEPEAVPTILRPYSAWGNRGPATMRVWLPACGDAG